MVRTTLSNAARDVSAASAAYDIAAASLAALERRVALDGEKYVPGLAATRRAERAAYDTLYDARTRLTSATMDADDRIAAQLEHDTMDNDTTTTTTTATLDAATTQRRIVGPIYHWGADSDAYIHWSKGQTAGTADAASALIRDNFSHCRRLRHALRDGCGVSVLSVDELVNHANEHVSYEALPLSATNTQHAAYAAGYAEGYWFTATDNGRVLLSADAYDSGTDGAATASIAMLRRADDYAASRPEQAAAYAARINGTTDTDNGAQLEHDTMDNDTTTTTDATATTYDVARHTRMNDRAGYPPPVPMDDGGNYITDNAEGLIALDAVALNDYKRDAARHGYECGTRGYTIEEAASASREYAHTFVPVDGRADGGHEQLEAVAAAWRVGCNAGRDADAAGYVEPTTPDVDVADVLDGVERAASLGVADVLHVLTELRLAGRAIDTNNVRALRDAAMAKRNAYGSTWTMDERLAYRRTFEAGYNDAASA